MREVVFTVLRQVVLYSLKGMLQAKLASCVDGTPGGAKLAWSSN